MEIKSDAERHKKRLRSNDELSFKSFKKDNTNDSKLQSESFKKNNNVDDKLICKSFKKNNDDDELYSKSFKKNNIQELSSKINDKFKNFYDFDRLERRYVECGICQKICPDESALQRHCERHLFQNYTTCGVCSKKFPSVSSMHEHFKLHRSCIYTCNECNEEFRSKEKLAVHVCSKTYSCNVCNHAFKTKDDLLKHFFIHKSSQGSYLHFTND